MIPSYILKRVQNKFVFGHSSINITHKLLNKFNNKRSELKYLSNFRKKNQTRFYD